MSHRRSAVRAGLRRVARHRAGLRARRRTVSRGPPRPARCRPNCPHQVIEHLTPRRDSVGGLPEKFEWTAVKGADQLFDRGLERSRPDDLQTGRHHVHHLHMAERRPAGDGDVLLVGDRLEPGPRDCRVRSGRVRHQSMTRRRGCVLAPSSSTSTARWSTTWPFTQRRSPSSPRATAFLRSLPPIARASMAGPTARSSRMLFGRPLERDEWRAHEREKEGLYRELSRGRIEPMPGLLTLLESLEGRSHSGRAGNLGASPERRAHVVGDRLGQHVLDHRARRSGRAGQAGA